MIFLLFSACFAIPIAPLLALNGPDIGVASPKSLPVSARDPKWLVSGASPISQDPITSWIQEQTTAPGGTSWTGLMDNIFPNGTVIASPSTSNPNYDFMWMRDAALTMDTIVSLYSNGQSTFESQVWSYAALVSHFQSLSTQTGLGEPKFNVDGTPFTGDWCRPQSDGQALTASTLMRFANAYLAKGGDVTRVQSQLYTPNLSFASPIKMALEYVSHNWQATTCDLWEEVRSQDHFYTRMVQRRALLEGAAFATTMNDPGAASWYASQANLISIALESHFDSNRGYIVETPSYLSRSGLNAGTFLAVIHTDRTSGGSVQQFSPIDDRVLASASYFMQSFASLYGVNSVTTNPSGQPLGLALGRYPEDVYDGTGTSQGNPWFLCTNAMAELFYRAVLHYTQNGSITVTSRNKRLFDYLNIPSQLVTYQIGSDGFNAISNGLISSANNLIRRVQFHSDNGKLPEEFNRDSGMVQGAFDLTWSYASVFTASWALSSASPSAL